jgi:hypothetical protein
MQQRSPGRNRTNVSARRYLKARAAERGGVAPLSRDLGLPQQTIVRAINGDGLRDGNALLIVDRLRRLGFTGPTGLELGSSTLAPTDNLNAQPITAA